MGNIFSKYKIIINNSKPKYNKQKIGLDHFEIQKVIGKGGFGKVNAVKKISEPLKGHWFALKTLSKKMILLSDNGDATRLSLIAERNILTLINHPFICNLHCIYKCNYIRCFSR